MPDITALQDQLDATNRERAEAEADLRGRAVKLRQERDALYLEAVTRRDAVGRAAIDNRTGKIVTVYDPDALDKDTLAILAHMGTPVPPVDEVYPDGVTLPGKKGK